MCEGDASSSSRAVVCMSVGVKVGREAGQMCDRCRCQVWNEISGPYRSF